MTLNFSDFYRLEQLADVYVDGNFSTSWNGSYVRHWAKNSGYMQPHNGSCIVIKRLSLLENTKLPGDVQDLEGKNGLVYVIISTKYPILYVGISNKGLKNGVFGSGRLTHHSRKILAAAGSMTDHSSGWIEHATQRYQDIVNEISTSGKVLKITDLAPFLWGDWRIAIAAIERPEKHEGVVLDQFVEKIRSIHKDVRVQILNTGSIQREDIVIKFPANLLQINEVANPLLAISEKNIIENIKDQTEADLCVEENECCEIDLMSTQGIVEDVKNFSEPCKSQFLRVLAWVRSLTSVIGLQEKFIRGYTNQPSNYNNTPLLNFAELGPSGRAKSNGWVCRVPLKCSEKKPMSVILPKSSLAATAQEHEITRGIDANFRPNDLEDFLRRPSHYTNLR